MHLQAFLPGGLCTSDDSTPRAAHFFEESAHFAGGCESLRCCQRRTLGYNRPSHSASALTGMNCTKTNQPTNEPASHRPILAGWFAATTHPSTQPRMSSGWLVGQFQPINHR